MIENYTIVMPLIHSWNWTADFQKQTGLTLAKNNNSVVALQLHKKPVRFKNLVNKRQKLIEKKGNNLFFITPFRPLPFERFQTIYKANEILPYYFSVLWLKIKFWRRKKIILWIFHPKHYWLIPFFRKFYKDRLVTIFDCVDFFASGNTTERKTLRKLEKRLIKEADVVVSISKTNVRYLKKTRKDVHLVPQGFRIEDFKNPVKPKHSFRKKHPTIGYVGGLNDRIDYELLIQLVDHNPKWQFIVWGPKQYPLLKRSPKRKKLLKMLLGKKNVVYGSTKDKREVYNIIKKFDVAIVPYDTSNSFNKNSYPMKIFEYFYLGKPVISTPISEFSRFPEFVMIGKNKKEWQTLLEKLLSKPWPEEFKREQRNISELNNWENKIKAVSKILNQY